MIVVTGATGHIGNVLVRKLVERGDEVRALVLPGEDIRPLTGLAVEIVEGDVRHAATLERAFAGAGTVYHLAGIVSILPGQARMLQEVNVRGTRHVVEACLAAGTGRLVYTSSVHAFPELPAGLVLDEEVKLDPEKVIGPYGRSKALATLEVLRGVRQGLDAVIVFPSGVIGPYDHKPSEVGQLILDCSRGRMKAYLDGAYDFVDVRDVADGIIAAGEKGRKGEGYILCGQWVTVRDLLRMIADVTGNPAPSFRAPHWLAQAAAVFTAVYYRAAGKVPRFTPYSIHVLGSNARMSRVKARRELGYEPRPLAESVGDSVGWFRMAGKL